MSGIPKQRALVLQGGGALGAYEVGVFKALCESLAQSDADQDKPLFDIVAGTSIGAINGAILVSYVKKHKSWQGADQYLESFWQHIASDSCVTEFWSNGWDTLRTLDSNAPTKEASRRYWSAKEYLASGAKRVFTPIKPRTDAKFLDPMNTWYQYDNAPLQQSIREFAKLPLATSLGDNEPRLLLTTVDVQQAQIVTFDSYSKMTEYGEPKVTMSYKDGVELQHLIASASVPVHYDYTEIKPDADTAPRYFWDGGILNNTPLRELITEHKRYWKEQLDKQSLEQSLFDSDAENAVNVPDLDVYIVNIWPKKETKVPQDYDGVVDRERDLKYSDKTQFDEKVAHTVNDYIDLSKELIALALEKGATQSEVDALLRQQVKAQPGSEESREYIDLLAGRFHVNVKRIERPDDENTISRKWMDFSAKTISTLIEQGYEDGKKQFSI